MISILKLKIIPTVVIIYIIIKRFKIFKVLLIIGLYKFFKIILNLIKVINYKNTLIGKIFSFYSYYTAKVKKIVYYYFLINVNLLTFYCSFLPDRFYKHSCKFDLGIRSFIVWTVIVAYNILRDLKILK